MDGHFFIWILNILLAGFWVMYLIFLGSEALFNNYINHNKFWIILKYFIIMLFHINSTWLLGGVQIFVIITALPWLLAIGRFFFFFLWISLVFSFVLLLCLERGSLYQAVYLLSLNKFLSVSYKIKMLFHLNVTKINVLCHISNFYQNIYLIKMLLIYEFLNLHGYYSLCYIL